MPKTETAPAIAQGIVTEGPVANMGIDEIMKLPEHSALGLVANILTPGVVGEGITYESDPELQTVPAGQIQEIKAGMTSDWTSEDISKNPDDLLRQD